MKKINLLIIVLILSITTIMAQTDPKPKPTKADMEANKEKMEAMKVAFITKELELTEQQAKTFWPIYNQQEDEKKAFANYFGTKVDVKVAGNGKGKITIPFHSEEDFNRILKLINS